MGLQPVAPAASLSASYSRDGQTPQVGQLRGWRLRLSWLAWSLMALGMSGILLVALPARVAQLRNETGASATALASALLGVSPTSYASYRLGLELLVPLCSLAVAALLVWRKPRAWPPLLLSHLLLVGGIASSAALPALGTRVPQAQTALTLVELYGALSFFLFAYLFPDGRLVPRWVWLPPLLVFLVNLSTLFVPGSLLDWTTWPRALELTLLTLIVATLPYAQIHRFRRVATLEQRQQIKWVLFGVSAAVLPSVLYAMLGRTLPALGTPSPVATVFHIIALHLTSVTSLLLPVSVAVALLRYRLWDIDPLLNGTLLYGALTLGVAAIYGLVLGLLSLVFQTQVNAAMALVATVVAASGLQLLRARLQRGVNRLLYGERDETYRVLARLGQRLETIMAPEAALQALVEIVHDALKLPYVALVLGDGADSAVVAAAGRPGEPLMRLPLVAQAHTIQLVGSGQAIFSPAIATRLIDFFGALQPSALPQAFPELTEREREILNLIARGQSNPQIARQLNLSSKTVANYVSNILGKLQVADRAQAMLRARDAGLGSAG